VFALLFKGEGYYTNYFPLIATSTSVCVVVKGVVISLGNVRQSRICPLVLFMNAFKGD
jgi:hypothetical protein